MVFSWIAGQIGKTARNIGDATRQTGRKVAYDDDIDVSRRQFVESGGAAVLTSMGIADALDDEDNVFTRTDGALESAYQELVVDPIASELEEQGQLESERDSGGVAGGDASNGSDQTPTDYSARICETYLDLDSGVQNNVYNHLVDLDRQGELSSIRVDSDYNLRSDSERIDDVSLTGDGQNTLGMPLGYAETWKEAYREDEDEFGDGVEQILDGECE